MTLVMAYVQEVTFAFVAVDIAVALDRDADRMD
mgnify:FL=1